jgi:3-oxoacyl-[acyl-carrier-protein] synthase II
VNHNLNEHDRIAVTGLGAITHYGYGYRSLYDGLSRDMSDDATRRSVWSSGLSSRKLEGFVINDEELDSYLSGGDVRKMDRFTKMNVAAVKMAIDDANLTGSEDIYTTGFIMNTTFGPWKSTNNYTIDMLKNGPAMASPRLFPNTVYNAAQGYVCIQYQLKGPASTLSGIPSTIYALDLLRKGVTDRIIVAGADELHDDLAEMYQAKGSSVIHGEGAGVLVLERLETALNRKAPIYAEVVDYEIASAPHYSSLLDDMKSSKETWGYLVKSFFEKGLSASDRVQALFLNRNGADGIDESEEGALSDYFGKDRLGGRTYRLKQWIGETFGASHALQSIYASLLLNRSPQGGEALVFNADVGGNHTLIGFKKYETH